MMFQTDRFGNHWKWVLSSSWILNPSRKGEVLSESAVLGGNLLLSGTCWVALGKSLHLSGSVFSPEKYKQEYLAAWLRGKLNQQCLVQADTQRVVIVTNATVTARLWSLGPENAGPSRLPRPG